MPGLRFVDFAPKTTSFWSLKTNPKPNLITLSSLTPHSASQPLLSHSTQFISIKSQALSASLYFLPHPSWPHLSLALCLGTQARTATCMHSGSLPHAVAIWALLSANQVMFMFFSFYFDFDFLGSFLLLLLFFSFLSASSGNTIIISILFFFMILSTWYWYWFWSFSQLFFFFFSPLHLRFTVHVWLHLRFFFW